MHNVFKPAVLLSLMASATAITTRAVALEGPRTLFELSGAERPAISWKNSVLVIIDAQKQYESGVLALPGVDSKVRVIKALLNKARRLQVPVIHVVHEGAGPLFDPQSEGFGIISDLQPLPGETVIRKRLTDAFAGTDLQKVIEGYGVNRKPVLVGFMTHMCVSATAFAALDLGFQTIVVSDAVGTRSLRGVSGEIIPASQVNEATLASLQDRVAWIVKSPELLGAGK